MSAILRFVFLLSCVVLLQARKGFGPGEQEWGHVDVRPGAHMFFWLFYVQDPKVTSIYERPLVVWLQGGPGESSTGFGNFEEIGPLFTNKTARPTSWAKHVNVLFIDNPVGAGFSYVDNLSQLTRTNAQIGRDMISFLSSFYKKFPKFEKTPFYIFSESYGAKMAVEIARQLLDANNGGKLNINFKGVALGDSWISPMDSINTWAPFLYYTGMVDQQGRGRLNVQAQNVQNAVDAGQWSQATDMWRKYVGDVQSEAANVDFYNIMYKVKSSIRHHQNKALVSAVSPRFEFEELQKLMEGSVKKALGIPSQIVYNNQTGDVFQYLKEDFMKPVVDVVEELLNNTNLQVVVFTGNLDLTVDTPGTVAWVDKMRWKGANGWKTAPRRAFVVKGYVEGFVKNLGNLYFYWIHRAGHMVPTDNPEAALDMLRRSTGFDKRESE